MDQPFVNFNHKLALKYTPKPEQGHYQHADSKLVIFLSWLCEEIPKEITLIRKNHLAYYRFLETNLPYEKRTGRNPLRSTFWEIALSIT